jgi:hypothetical protein
MFLLVLVQRLELKILKSYKETFNLAGVGADSFQGHLRIQENSIDTTLVSTET